MFDRDLELKDGKLVEIQKSVTVETKDGTVLTFGDADDYLISNEGGWLHLKKDGEVRGSILLSRVDSVYINF